ncbi:3-methyladenine DNA glycosylase AlkD [Desulfonatronum thiosulfatophilum]|uniref:3-methyladenine DNA glycosylase AlkD n=1 Tax=Desulfonatronum thiosulfatophilum TaxID=617002 RepID=A0A1G6DL80_9BACT|nr:DNA alkylation repair protein [Desulfonatronum thiosulfatophilum]SDB45944.1 3-methyladenine DNA glycosylase AlkD [Desulfonatronum thiosulfatophilum]
MDDIIRRMRVDLEHEADPRTKSSGQRFFREQVQLHGVRTAVVTRIAKKYFKEIRMMDKEPIFDLCEELWKSGYLEESFIACNWSHALSKYYERGDFQVFERWVDRYVANWASCDTLCNHTIGSFLEMYPENLPNLQSWAKSPNRWMRRASAVSLIIPARRGKFLREVFALADILLMDADDLVRKGYGWMLKSASQAHQKEVFEYVLARKTVMPRTALRYAIEKMPREWRDEAMGRVK